MRACDGSRKKLIIRRLQCDRCHQIHHELPDILVPYKRYGSEAIERVLTSPEDLGDFPGETGTIVRIRSWFSLLRPSFESILSSLMLMFDDSPELAEELGSLYPLRPPDLANGWLKHLVRIIVNSSRWPQTRFA